MHNLHRLEELLLLCPGVLYAPSTQDEEASTQDEEASMQDEEASTQDEKASTQDEKASTQDEKASTQDKEASTQDKEASTQDEEASTQDQEASTQDEEASTLRYLSMAGETTAHGGAYTFGGDGYINVRGNLTREREKPSKRFLLFPTPVPLPPGEFRLTTNNGRNSTGGPTAKLTHQYLHEGALGLRGVT